MSVAGTWNLSIKTPMGEQKPVLTLAEESGVLTGSMAMPGGDPVEIKDGKSDGSAVSWKANVKMPIPMGLTFTGTMEGDSFTGTCKPGMFPGSPVTGVRV